MNKPFRRFCFLCTITTVLLLLASCAQMVPLSGGERDTSPPQVIKQFPENKTTSFSGKDISIEFDEYIQVKDLQNQLIITPRLLQEPEINAAGKILRMHFKETLQANTTYNINFGNSIADVREGNVLAGLTVIFSTGPVLDSLRVSGKINDAFTLKPAPDCSVFLYLNGEDSCMFKRKPDYFSKTDNTGNYTINYLRSGTYKVIALSDKNKNYIYDQGEEQVAPLLSDSASDLELKSNAQLDFSVFREKASRIFIKRTLYPEYGKTVFVFNRSDDSLMAELSYDPQKRAIVRFSEKKDTLHVFYKKGPEDSIGISIRKGSRLLEQVTLQTQSTEKYEKDLKLKRLVPEIKTLGGLNTGKLNAIYFDMPLIEADASKILFITEKDTFRIRETLNISGTTCSWTNAFARTGKSKLVLLPGAVKGFNDIPNDTTSYPFAIAAKEEVATLHLNLQVPAKTNYRLQLISDKGEIHPVTFTIHGENVTTLTIERIIPGAYTLRMWEDRNNDAEWNSGHLINKLPAEKIWYYDKPVKLMADWEISIDWKL